jgi:hypothetical protein
MNSKNMPPVPPANRSPKGPGDSSKPSPDTDVKGRRLDEMKEGGQQDNIQQNTRNQGNPTSRGGNPHAR